MIATRSTGRLGPFQQWKVTDSERKTPNELIGIVRLSDLFVSYPFLYYFGGQKPIKIYIILKIVG